MQINEQLSNSQRWREWNDMLVWAKKQARWNGEMMSKR
jgi:hypothetical protein